MKRIRKQENKNKKSKGKMFFQLDISEFFSKKKLK